jgi:hypothetical protein
MKIRIEPVVDVQSLNVEEVAWGMSDAGNPIFRVRISGRTVIVELSPEQARDFGCAAIVAAAQTLQIRAERAATNGATRIVRGD